MILWLSKCHLMQKPKRQKWPDWVSVGFSLSKPCWWFSLALLKMFSQNLCFKSQCSKLHICDMFTYRQIQKFREKCKTRGCCLLVVGFPHCFPVPTKWGEFLLGLLWVNGNKIHIFQKCGQGEHADKMYYLMSENPFRDFGVVTPGEISRSNLQFFHLAISAAFMHLHPGKLTWNLKITCWKRKMILQTSIFGFQSLIFQGVTMFNLIWCHICQPSTPMFWQLTSTYTHLSIIHLW